MTIYEISNIEHATVSDVGAMGYRIVMHDGWYVHLRDNESGVDENGNSTKIYKNIALLRNDYDFSLVEICAKEDLPTNAEI